MKGFKGTKAMKPAKAMGAKKDKMMPSPKAKAKAQPEPKLVQMQPESSTTAIHPSEIFGENNQAANIAYDGAALGQKKRPFKKSPSML